MSAELWTPKLPFPFDLERAIDDWVFMCFFCGNDFLPHLPCLDVRENSIDILLDIWKSILPRLKTYMTCDGKLNLESVEMVLKELGNREGDIFKTRHIQEIRKKKLMKEENNKSNKMFLLDKIDIQQSSMNNYRCTTLMVVLQRVVGI